MIMLFFEYLLTNIFFNFAIRKFIGYEKKSNIFCPDAVQFYSNSGTVNSVRLPKF